MIHDATNVASRLGNRRGCRDMIGGFAHRVPVVGDLLESQRLADVNQVQDVLLEAGAAKADAGVQEFGADARVRANCVRHLREGGAALKQSIDIVLLVECASV